MSDKFDGSSAIAIVGVAGRFPRAADVEQYWKNLRDGLECTTRFTPEELEAAGEDPARLRQPNYVPIGAPLEGMDEFDAGFFGFSPRDASIMDPQHRHILEVAWEALEDGGIDPEKFDGAIGVFAGSGHNAYMPYNLLTNPALVDSVGFFLLRHTGNDKDFLATRISYCLKLTGPSVNVQTACSTSLVAIHMACQSLLNSECDLALAGGVTLELPHRRGYVYEDGEILSPDGKCRSFDAASKGTIFGSGVGVVALRRYDDAVAAGDVIHAVIRGSAVNNDGANKVGYLAPSVEGQAACVGEALALSGVDARTISYVECHGTGTPVGDPIEVAALTQAFREATDDNGFCAIGSVKSNIGHLDTAAGVASLIKVVKSLENRQIPASLHFKSPNPQLEIESTPFFVNAQLAEWKPPKGTPRRAAVNSLGVGGTNAFVVLEEAPAQPASGPSRGQQLLTLSARSPEAATKAAHKLADFLADHPETKLADVAFTLATGRRAFPHRRTVVAKDTADAIAALRDPGRAFAGKAGDKRNVAFLFPGGGAQYANMARELYDSEPVYKKEVDGCLSILKKHADFDLKALLFPSKDAEASANEALQHGSRTLTSLFITEYALAKLFMSWGVNPSALLGHSMGEYVAACLAGVFSVEDGLRMVLLRGQLFEQVEKGAMLSVPLPRAELEALIGPDLDIAVENGPSMSVASGPVALIEALDEKLKAKDVDTRRVLIHVAAHSRMLEPILPAFAKLTKSIKFSAPKIPFLSNVSGTWITEKDATDPDYWVRHLRGTVRFSDNLATLLADPERVILEVAPGRTLSSLAKAHPAAGLGRPIFNSLRHPSEDVSDVGFLLGVLGKLWASGVTPDWKAYFGSEKRRRIALPTYAFEHQRYWIEPGKTQAAAATRSLKKKPDLADWFYQPSWKRQLLPSAPSVAVATSSNAPEPWLIFLDDGGLGAKLVYRLRSANQPVVTVGIGKKFAAVLEKGYQIRPDSPEDYDQLWSTLEERGLLPRRVLHLWSLLKEDAPIGVEAFHAEQARGFYSLLFLAQAIGKAGTTAPLGIGVISNRMQQVAAEPLLRPERATLLGPVKVAMQELPGVVCRSIDIDLPRPDSWQEQLLLERLPQEVMIPSADHVIAYRGHDRFVQTFEPVKLAAPALHHSRLKTGGVYLVTGGLGGLGLVLARHLATAHAAKLVLVGRSTAGKEAEIRALEALGAQVLVEAADVTSLADMKRVVAAAKQRFGVVNGVFHTAGVLDDGIIQLKTREQAAAVLAPKTIGTLVLDEALRGLPLDFVVLYSSVSAFTGLTGQVDYAAANAFLDAFAHAKTERDGIFTIAVNWNAWQKVGMAAELARHLGVGGGGAADRPAHHPLLDRCVRDTDDRREYASTLRTDTHWVVGEHRIKGGEALVPGTGYVELVRAALAETPVPGKAIEIRELTFLAPFVVRDGEARELRVVLEKQDDAWDARVTGPGGSVHATGQVAYTAAPPATTDSLAAIAASCTNVKTFDSAADENLDFGPRWNNRRSVAYGQGEALLTLELPAEHAADVAGYALHPALLDFATAGAQELVAGVRDDKHFYVPMSYGRLRQFAPLPAAIRSHVRLTEATGDVAVYEVTIFDPAGKPLVEISDFVMRRIENRQVMSEVAQVEQARSIEARGEGEPAVDAPRPTTGNPILELGLEQGILPEEGMLALERVLAGPLTAQLIVSSQDLDALVESVRPAEPWEKTGSEDASEATGVRVPRPSLATPFVAPETPLEKSVAAVWQEILGVDGIGVNDDFFDLGGHSLLLTQVLSRVRKQAKAEVSLRAMFEKRTVAGIVAEIEKAKATGAPSATRLARADRAAYRDADGQLAFPASFMQQRLWFLDQLEPGRAVYNIPQAFRLQGPLRVDLVQRALNEIARRHESLRTRFGNAGGSPLQLVDAAGDVALELVDLRDRPDPLAAAKELAEAAARQAFDLARGPLLRAAVYQLAPNDHVLFLNVHHIVCDGWSLALLFGELSQLYTAFAAGKGSPLPAQNVQYADFSVFQHAQTEVSEASLAFWKNYLSGELPQLTLPFDRKRPATASLQGKLARFHVPAELTDRLAAIAREERASLFMTLLTAFQAFLHRISGQNDIRVGSPIANRDREEIREAIGFYTNTIVFRGDLAGAPSFRALLGKTRETAMQVLAHQDVPLERVVEAVNPDRRSGDNPLFQVMFAMQKAPESAMSLPGIRVENVDVHSATAKFDLLLEMQELTAGLQCFFEYATDLFDDATAERLVGHFQHMLAGIAANPDASIASIPLLTEAQRREIVETWNATSAEYPRDARLSDRVAAVAAANPGAVAVEAGEGRLTYGELNERANQLAHHLQSLGARPDSFVGIYLERGLDMVVALLGVLKSGAAYLPLDPAFPEDRIAHMLSDSKAPIVITQTSLADALPAHEAKLVRVDADRETISAFPPSAPASDATADSLAYMIYTSGSTGKPKGVQLAHRGVVSFQNSMAKAPGFGPHDKLLAVTTLSFDISVLEVFLPLTTGGTVVIASKDEAVDGAELMARLERSNATVMQATPATWLMLMEAGWKGSPMLQKVLCGGEAWPAGLARELLSRVPEVWNMYGPTETTIWSTCQRIVDPDDITVGKPIDNTVTYVLDRYLQPVPVGVAGELHIGGDGVARGYHDRPELTAERFIANPLGAGRIYKTGDLVKHRPDGRIQYLDRMDNQVKVRGYRIELGEIEAVLEKHPAVKQPVVIVWDSGNGDKRLAAYIVYEPGQTLTSSELRKFLRTHLPDYMIPHLFVEMAALPLTANGKVNRRALPDPLKQSGGEAREFAEPATDNEKLLAELWRQTLKIDKIGRGDNFFDLGGHSLLSAQVTFQIEKATGYRINPRAMVFQSLEQIAAELPTPEVKKPPVVVTKTVVPPPSAAPPPPKPLAMKLFDKLRNRLR